MNIMETKAQPASRGPVRHQRTIAERVAARQRSIAIRLKHIKALELRKSGQSYDQIATELEYKSRSSAQRAVENLLTKMAEEPARILKHLTIARLDSMLKAIWPKAEKGNLGAIDRVIRIEEIRGKLLGFNAPIEVNIRAMVMEVQLQLGLTDDEAAALTTDAERYLAQVRASSRED